MWFYNVVVFWSYMCKMEFWWFLYIRFNFYILRGSIHFSPEYHLFNILFNFRKHSLLNTLFTWNSCRVMLSHFLSRQALDVAEIMVTGQSQLSLPSALWHHLYFMINKLKPHGLFLSLDLHKRKGSIAVNYFKVGQCSHFPFANTEIKAQLPFMV